MCEEGRHVEDGKTRKREGGDESWKARKIGRMEDGKTRRRKRCETVASG